MFERRWADGVTLIIPIRLSSIDSSFRYSVAFYIFLLWSLLATAWPGISFAQEEHTVYTLGSGDKLRIAIFGEEDMSGEFEVDGSGYISMPLIREIQVSGLTLRQAEQVIVSKLLEGFLKEPQVSVEVLNYRPFYILGEVKKPGSYSYVNGIAILNAVAMAEGFTYRANEKIMLITRANDPQQKERKVPLDTKVLPGDIIRVQERFF